MAVTLEDKEKVVNVSCFLTLLLLWVCIAYGQSEEASSGLRTLQGLIMVSGGLLLYIPSWWKILITGWGISGMLALLLTWLDFSDPYLPGGALAISTIVVSSAKQMTDG